MAYESTNDGSGWGRSEIFTEMAIANELVPVEVIEGSEALLIPREVQLTFNYYQVTRKKKRLVTAEISFARFCTADFAPESVQRNAKFDILPCDVNDANYTLQFSLNAMNYMQLLNAFEFTFDVYALFFIIMGILVVVIGIILWALNRFLTKLRNPPKFRFNSLMSIMIPPGLWGFVLASVPFWLLVGMMWVWFYTLASPTPSTSPNAINFETWTPSWSTGATWSDEAANYARRGRFGFALLALAIAGLYQVSTMFIPFTLNSRYDDDITKESGDGFDQEAPDALENREEAIEKQEAKEAEEAASIWRPLYWRRSQMFVAYVMFAMLMTVFIQFSFSDTFQDSQYAFLAIIKLFSIIFEIVVTSSIRDALVLAPLLVFLDVTSLLMTMGAANFTSFVVAYFVELAMNLGLRLYIDPGVNAVLSLIPKWVRLCYVSLICFLYMTLLFRLLENSIQALLAQESGADDPRTAQSGGPGVEEGS
jgi:hypothetical protein